MDTINQILNGFVVAAQPTNLLFLLVGAFLGTIIGMLPGIGAASGIALLLPMTFGMDPIPALIMLAGIYYGAMYGNTSSAVLIGTPGGASSAMTTMDGYPMARQGRAGAALAIAAIASCIAGTIGIIALSLLAVPLARFAVRFGPAEYFALMFFAMTAVSILTGRSVPKGLFAALFGLMIATVGIDLQSGVPRFTFGVIELMEGVSFLVVLVGLFAVSETLTSVERWYSGELHPIRIQGRLWFTRDEWKRAVGPMFRGGVIGFLIGILPGTGGTLATVLSYSVEKRLSKTPERFGNGAIEGVAGPEAANNAATSGAFVPLLTLGIPGSGTTAVLLGAFMLYGVAPGPRLFTERPDLVWGLIDSMYIGNLILLVLNLPLIGLFVRVLYMPSGILLALILGFAMIGVYSVHGSLVDLSLLVVVGAIGYVFRKVQVPIPPIILGLVLGAPMEQSFRQALTFSDGNPMILVSSPISATLIVMSAIAIFLPLITHRLKRRFDRMAADEATNCTQTIRKGRT